MAGSAGGKGRFLKWAMGCLVLMVLGFVVLVAILWQGLSSWDAELTPWPRLPPKTFWAAHVHDVATVSKAAFRDKGVRSLVQTLSIDTGGSGDAADWRSKLPVNAIRFYDYLGFLHKVVAPNILLIGATDRDPKAMFIITHPPAWMRFLLNWSGEAPGVIQATEAKDDEPATYYSERDGWLISSQHRETVQEVLDAWDTETLPLGPGSGRIDAHVYLAGRTEAATGTEEKSEPISPTHFTLADPFAMAASTPATKNQSNQPALRVLLTPDNGNWRVVGEARRRESFRGDDEFLMETVAKILGDKAPALAPAPGQDLALFLTLDDAVRRRIQDSVDGMTQDRDPSRSHPIHSLAARWLGEAWLADAGNEWMFRGAPPVLEQGDLPYPVLPVFSLGWTVVPDRSLEDAAKRFGNSLSNWVEAVRSPGGSPTRQAFLATISHSFASDSEGAIAIPSILANGAHPAWRFVEDSATVMGWIATDPAGLPDGKDGEAKVLAAMPVPDPEHAGIAGGWRLSSHFVEALAALLQDRYRMLSLVGMADELPEPDKIKTILPLLQQAAVHFPKGTLSGDLDCEKQRFVFTSRIDHGVP